MEKNVLDIAMQFVTKHSENKSCGWIDSHCHLDFSAFDSDREKLIEQLKMHQCTGVVVPGVTSAQWSTLKRLTEQFPGFISTAFGLHPYFIDTHLDDDLQKLETCITENKPVAVGEIGLDFYESSKSPDYLDEQKQQTFFIEQVKLAKKHGLPIILHGRKSHDQIQKGIKNARFEFGGIIHGFSGSLQQARHYIELGFVLGLGGAVTHQRAQRLRKIVTELSDSDWVLETDAPDMKPAFCQTAINTPLNALGIAQVISELRNQPLDRVLTIATQNTIRVLSLSARNS